MADWIVACTGLLVAAALPLQALAVFRKRTVSEVTSFLFLLTMLVWNMPTVVSVVPEGILWGLGSCWVFASWVLVRMAREKATSS